MQRLRIPLLVFGLMATVTVAQTGLLAGTTVSLDPITTNTNHQGCVEYNGRIFVTARAFGGGTPHLIYEFDCTGTCIGGYEQSAASTANSLEGYWDGCVGTHPQSSSPGMAALYFGYAFGGVEVIDPASLVPPPGPPTVPPTIVPGPIIPIATFTNPMVGLFRGMAFDPNGDGGAGSIWTGDIGNALREISATAVGTAGAAGTLITTYFNPAPPNAWSIYGLAYDSTTGNLWASSAPSSGPIAEIDITSATPGALTGVVIPRAVTGSLQGGLSPLTPASPCQPAGSGLGGIVMIGLDQAMQDAYSLYDTTPEAKLLTGLSGGTQDDGQTPVYVTGAPDFLDWSLVSMPTGAASVTGAPAITVLNIGTVGAPPSATFNYTGGLIQLGNWVLEMEPPFTTPCSGFAPGCSGVGSLGIADGLGMGLLFLPPGLTTLSIHGFYPQDDFIDDPTAASIGPLPPAILPPGTALYMQTIYQDSGGNLRATNVAGWDFLSPAMVTIEAVGTNSFNADPASGFFKVTNVFGLQIDQIQFRGVGGMVFDTDQTPMADIFEGGNSTLTGCSGTYRNGCDVTCGLVYDALNTVPATPCDPTANTGWIGSNVGPPPVTDSWDTLDFRFTSFNLTGVVFEFDCDTDGGAGFNGGAMAGMMVTVTTPGAVLSGVLAPDPSDPNRSFLSL